MRIQYLFVGILLVSLCVPSFGQTHKYLTNPSFEDVPRQNQAPKGWQDCNSSSESPVDVHGPETNFFGVNEFAEDGDCFVGMVVRDNGTFEGISTKLISPLYADDTYRLTIKINQSTNYNSVSRLTDEPVNYDSTVLFEIWGGNLHCQMTSLLVQQKVEDQRGWTELTYYITPEKKVTYLNLYARQAQAYDTNGHILVDDLQLVRVDPVTLEEIPE